MTPSKHHCYSSIHISLELCPFGMIQDAKHHPTAPAKGGLELLAARAAALHVTLCEHNGQSFLDLAAAGPAALGLMADACARRAARYFWFVSHRYASIPMHSIVHKRRQI